MNVFDTGALAPGVTVDTVDYRILAIDAGVKYKGIFLQTEIYNRWLDDFEADGALPVSSIHDNGFYVQGAFFPMPKKLELYGATSQIFGDKDAGFDNSSEYLVGMNFYPVEYPQRPAEHAVDRCEPLAGQQRVWLLRGRPEGHDVRDGVLGLLLVGNSPKAHVDYAFPTRLEDTS